jgi:PAS domain S-box-containing protein
MRKRAAVIERPSEYCAFACTKCLVRDWVFLIVCVLVLAAASPRLSFAVQTSLPKTVLVLYRLSDREAQDGSESLKSTTRSGVSAPVNFEVKYLDSEYFEAPSDQKALSESLAGVSLTHVDWRQRRRWSVPKSALPANVIVLYGLPTGWAGYRRDVVFGLAPIAALALLVIGLWWQRARSQKGTLRLRESERQYRLMADTIPALVWICDEKGSVTYLNDKRIAFTGVDSGTGFGGDIWSDFIHPDDLQGVLSANLQALERQKGFSKEYRLRRCDGVYRWFLDIAAPRIGANGSFTGFIGSAVDITDQKLARDALEKIGGKLIEAQEKESRRIARELHDNICQRLALLSMELEQAKWTSNDSPGEANAKIEEIRQHCAAIAVDVQALSHNLHSSKLEYLGMVPAIRSLCRELSQQYAVSVEFTNENVPDFVPQEISLSLFRVTQEALHNAVKHSDVSTFSVCLRGRAGEIQLEVADRGIGFDVERAKGNRGLGLISMEERVHLVHGIFSIDSQVNCGTRVLVRVPWSE